ncbi:MAG: hypothetical protein AAGD11_14345 [Planctomycetota bacterium]
MSTVGLLLQPTVLRPQVAATIKQTDAAKIFINQVTSAAMPKLLPSQTAACHYLTKERFRKSKYAHNRRYLPDLRMLWNVLRI